MYFFDHIFFYPYIPCALNFANSQVTYAQLNFWGLFGGKMSVAATPAPKGLGPRNPTKKLAHVGVLLSNLLSQNRVPELSDPEPPPLPLNKRVN